MKVEGTLVGERTALVIGATGQDGAYLTRFLLRKGYKVVATRRRTSMLNTQRLDYVLANEDRENLYVEYLDLSDAASISRIVHNHLPDEIYNLAAQSHVGVSFEQPEYTADVNGLGVLRILESIRMLQDVKNIRFYQASTSELFGAVREWPQNEDTPFNAVSPYAVAKEFAHKMVGIYRSAYGIHACCGILFNHESPLRGLNFVTKKIVRGLCRFAEEGTPVVLGNLDSVRDWGHAEDFVEMQWMMLNRATPVDYVIATGVATTVREFVCLVAEKLSIELEWSGVGLTEVATCVDSANLHLIGKPVVTVSEAYFRPLEVERLLGNANRARDELGWVPSRDLGQLIDEMIEFEGYAGSFDAI